MFPLLILSRFVRSTTMLASFHAQKCLSANTRRVPIHVECYSSSSAITILVESQSSSSLNPHRVPILVECPFLLSSLVRDPRSPARTTHTRESSRHRMISDLYLTSRCNPLGWSCHVEWYARSSLRFYSSHNHVFLG